jgi:hypothetical protein
MRVPFAIAGLIVCAALLATPAGAAEIFNRGPVTCTALSPLVTAMTLGKCKWRIEVKRRALVGSCAVSLTVDGREVTFTASGEMRRLEEELPDNDLALDAAYPGVMSCSVDSKRVMAVHNCQTELKGLTKQCDVCVKLLGTHCYAASGSVAVNGDLPPELTRADARGEKHD